MKLTKVQEHLIRRMTVNYLAYMGQKSVTKEWLEGYFQAKKDCNNFLEQHKIFEPNKEENEENRRTSGE
jgi:hypothetical protein